MKKKAEVATISPEFMEKIHTCGQELLEAFAHICESNHLRYYLIAGTLLGAVRHHGPIPWDDDVDVSMPREDFEKFKRIMLARPEGELYHIHCHENDPSYISRFVRLMKQGTVYLRQDMLDRELRFTELWLDIFPLDDAPSKITYSYRLVGWKLRWIYKFEYIKSIKRANHLHWKGKIAHFVLRPFSVEKILAYDRKLMRKYEGKNYDHYVSWGSHYHFIKQTMPKSWYEPSTTVEYSGRKYCAPGQWDKVLTRLYGDYMKPPAEQDRSGHGGKEIKF